MSTSRDGAGPNAAAVTPADAVEVRALHFADDGTVPNNPVLPMLLMRGAIAPGASPEAIAVRLEASGWGGTWVWLAGVPLPPLPPERAGDVVVLPAGTGHRQLEASADFAVVGAYPPGQEAYETVRAEQPHDPTTLDRIAAVARPRTDPIYGADGPLMQASSG